MEKIKKNLLNFFKKQSPWKVALEVGLLILVIIFIFGWGIYKYNWDNKATKAVSSIIPYPAAIVDYTSWITISEFNSELTSIKQYYKEAEGLDFSKEEARQKLVKIREELLSQLIENEIINSEAKKLGLSISETEVSEEYNKLVQGSGGEEKIKEQIKKYYNWTISEFKEKIKAQLLREKLDKKISEEGPSIQEAKKKAEDILARAKAGEDFVELAKRYSQDNLSSPKGGDMGYILKGTYVLEFENAAYSLGKGEIYPDLVKTYEGYHILKCTDIKGGQPRISQILIRGKNFYEWLADKKKEVKIWRFLHP